jgi:hypothetical protein
MTFTMTISIMISTIMITTILVIITWITLVKTLNNRPNLITTYLIIIIIIITQWEPTLYLIFLYMIPNNIS